MRVGILGSGNIGTDLAIKIARSPVLELDVVAGIDPDSDGLAKARALGARTTHEGIDGVLSLVNPPMLVFDATSASAHRRHADLLAQAGIQSIDLTPAKLGPVVVPPVNGGSFTDAPDINLLSCGAQATTPIVAACSRVGTVSYAEMVSTIASKSAGPATRSNIDEFTRTTAAGLREVGGAAVSKAIIVLNPAEPPIMMRNTVFIRIEPVDEAAVAASIKQMVADVQAYVPGYRLKGDPIFDDDHITVLIEVEGAGDYLPPYAGNLDIMTSAAIRVAEGIATR